MTFLKSLTTVSIMTLCSRILGFTRDMIIAQTFGAGSTTDAFFIAFKLPNLLRRIFAEGAFSQAFIPVLAEYKNNANYENIRLFIANIFGALLFILSIITIISVICAPWIVFITAPGFITTKSSFMLTNLLLRIMFPYIILISLASLASAILNMWNYFFIPALTPIILNVTIISLSLFATSYFHPPIMTLAFAVIIGGILQLGYQLISLKKIGLLVMPKIDFKNTGVWLVIRGMVPSIFGVSMNQISAIVNSVFTSFLVTGSISWIYYADRLIEFPCGVLGVGLCTVLFPLISKSAAEKDHHKYSRLINTSLQICLILTVPMSIAIIILAHPLVVVLFQRGTFTAFDSSMTELTLIGYSIGLIGIVLVKVLVLGFYSHRDIKTPVNIAIFTLIIIQIINVLFIHSLKHVSLSLSISLGSTFQAIMLYWKLSKKPFFFIYVGWIKLIINIIIAVLLMTVILIITLKFMPPWEDGIFVFRLAKLFIICLIMGIIYLLTLTLLGVNFKKMLSDINS
ncbi:MAG: murein biosynthesis integral membrane protein MurJ [Pantoea sp. Brub]|nr:murein biosynthesis integral membrane protein MurJ [Pantoea sp. Brub]